MHDDRRELVLRGGAAERGLAGGIGTGSAPAARIADEDLGGVSADLACGAQRVDRTRAGGHVAAESHEPLLIEDRHGGGGPGAGAEKSRCQVKDDDPLQSTSIEARSPLAAAK